MYEIRQLIPDAQDLLNLEPEELGAKILFILRKRINPPFLFSNLLGELWPGTYPYNAQPSASSYPQGRREEIDLALAEAWAWLVAQGLLVPAPGQHGGPDWRVLSRRARRFVDESEFVRFAIARKLQKETLHPRIADKVWSAFMRGDFDIAVLQAMKSVEVAVREASGLDDLIGVDLMRKAFHPKDGPLTDSTADAGEREARSALFAGAIGSYKNPHSHRDIQLDDPTEAAEIIMFSNHLLRIVDARAPKTTK